MADYGEQTITVTRGERAVLPFAPQVATDLTLATLAFSVATSSGKSVLLTLTTGDGIGGQTPGGEFTVTISPARTKAPAAGQYRWDAWRTDDGSEAPIAGGVFRVKEPVRRP